MGSGSRRPHPGPPRLLLVTSSADKEAELRAILGDAIEVERRSVDLTEIQGAPEKIARAKAGEAFKRFRRMLIVEDTSLHLDCCGGMPGPYIRDYMQAMGVEGLARMAAAMGQDGATARVTIALHLAGRGKGEKVRLFVGELRGRIVAPRGSGGHCWDSVFQPDGHQRTYAEMSAEEKNAISVRAIAVKQLATFIRSMVGGDAKAKNVTPPTKDSSKEMKVEENAIIVPKEKPLESNAAAAQPASVTQHPIQEEKAVDEKV